MIPDDTINKFREKLNSFDRTQPTNLLLRSVPVPGFGVTCGNVELARTIIGDDIDGTPVYFNGTHYGSKDRVQLAEERGVDWKAERDRLWYRNQELEEENQRLKSTQPKEQ